MFPDLQPAVSDILPTPTIAPATIEPPGHSNVAMQQDATDCNAQTPFHLPALPAGVGDLPAPGVPGPRLTGRQVLAITLLVTGHTDASAAMRVGVNRSTIFRWRLHNPVFAAELHRRQAEAYHVMGNRLRMIAMKCLRVVDHEVTRRRRYGEEPASRFALNVLRVVGADRLMAPEGSEEVGACADSQVRAARGPFRAGEPVNDIDRDDALSPWLDDPEGTGVTPEGPVETRTRIAFEASDRSDDAGAIQYPPPRPSCEQAPPITALGMAASIRAVRLSQAMDRQGDE